MTRPSKGQNMSMPLNTGHGEIEAELRGLRLSVLGAVFMALLGIVFAALTDSRAVLLDGLFSLIGAAVGLAGGIGRTAVLHKGETLAYGGLAITFRDFDLSDFKDAINDIFFNIGHV